MSCSRKIVAISDLAIVADSSFTVAKYFIEGMTSNKQVVNITSFKEDRDWFKGSINLPSVLHSLATKFVMANIKQESAWVIVASS